ncbi:MAG: RNA polymerase sigma factor [Bacteroidota bacterium]
MTHPDQVYIEALLSNDVLMVKKIYQAYIGKICGWILKNGGDANDADDVFQEALVSIYRRAAAGNFELTCPFEAFLFMACRNKWINMIQKTSRKGVTLTDFTGYTSADVAHDQSNDVQQHEAKEHLFKTKLAALGNACRELLNICYTTKSMEEVAEKMGFSYAYVRKKKSECMGKLTELVRNSPEYKKLYE